MLHNSKGQKQHNAWKKRMRINHKIVIDKRPWFPRDQLRPLIPSVLQRIPPAKTRNKITSWERNLTRSNAKAHRSIRSAYRSTNRKKIVRRTPRGRIFEGRAWRGRRNPQGARRSRGRGA